ncbi:antitoxin VapB family protein [Methanoplanus endosymbiosus]|nr:antitoxin VapB family protein [Methanoplanus endosymbiosus]UUX92538.1 hypothetical protein L6E24_14585 [Methanoplanus endosymbiosus]
MPTKTVNLSEEAYERLKTWKNNDEESFSSLILRILPKHRTVREAYEEFHSKHEGLTEEEAEKMKKDIE